MLYCHRYDCASLAFAVTDILSRFVRVRISCGVWVPIIAAVCSMVETCVGVCDLLGGYSTHALSRTLHVVLYKPVEQIPQDYSPHVFVGAQQTQRQPQKKVGMNREHAGQLAEASPCQATAAPLEAPAPRASSLAEIATPDPLGVMSHLMGTMSPEQLQEVLKGLQESGTSIVPPQVSVIHFVCTLQDCHRKWSNQSVVSSAAVCCNCDMDICLAQHKHYAFTNGFGACCCSVP